jgi:hypothetical protein
MADLTSNQVCNICCIHYNAGLRCCALGSLVEGGYLIAKDGGFAYILACASREVSRAWANRNDAVTVAQAGNPCGDWFIPSRVDLQYGHDCKGFWDSFSSAIYWSSTERNVSHAWQACFLDGTLCSFFPTYKTRIQCVRAFRRVLY